MRPYQVLIETDGYLEIQEHNIRPLSETLPNEIREARGRYIILPTEQDGTFIDEEGNEQPKMVSVPIKYCKWSNGLVAMTTEERAARDVYDAAVIAQAEADKQDAKPVALKEAENNFFALCYQLFGDYEKRGFDEINATIRALAETDQTTASALALNLLAINAECQREGGNAWWDSAYFHEMGDE